MEVNRGSPPRQISQQLDRKRKQCKREILVWHGDGAGRDYCLSKNHKTSSSS